MEKPAKIFIFCPKAKEKNECIYIQLNNMLTLSLINSKAYKYWNIFQNIQVILIYNITSEFKHKK